MFFIQVIESKDDNDSIDDVDNEDNNFNYDFSYDFEDIPTEHLNCVETDCSIGSNSHKNEVESTIIKGKIRLFKEDVFSLAYSPQIAIVMSIPSNVRVLDALKKLKLVNSSTTRHLRTIRMLRDDRTSIHYHLVISFTDSNVCESFVEANDGIVFSELMPLPSRVHLVSNIYITQNEDDLPSQSSPSQNDMTLRFMNRTELPHCPICFERLSYESSGVLQVICNHSFHLDCVKDYLTVTCPVCRNFIQPHPTPSCSVCGRTDDLWCCMICSYVGCGRKAEAHALTHFEETGHTFSIFLGDGTIWDYAEDRWANRLFHCEDGKVVEWDCSSDKRSEVLMESRVSKVIDDLYFEMEEELKSTKEQFNYERKQLNQNIDKLKSLNQMLMKNNKDLKEELAKRSSHGHENVNTMKTENTLLLQRINQLEIELGETMQEVNDLRVHLDAQTTLPENAKGSVKIINPNSKNNRKNRKKR
eukprot:TRINITY_DN4885_c0_g1_i1.p1 TRINITY_DN4885_c0_g1~~TRINITY_DN4885_c0_g1_i1.p1  ORF type:complete len:473 (+),score=113.99 TRINITY_DN4885_c0_g1_i1:50-1468(+)